MFKDLRDEWRAETRGNYDAVLDLLGHDNVPDDPTDQNVTMRGGFFLFRWQEKMSRPGFDGDKKPVVDVSWVHAQAFVRTAGGIYLLSDAQWEHAATGGDPKREYATQDGKLLGPDGTPQAHCSVKASQQTTIDVDDPRNSTTPDGVLGMTGNVWEWTDENPEQQWKYGLRGGSFFDYAPEYLRAACRNNDDPDDRYDYVGFRVGASAPQDSR